VTVKKPGGQNQGKMLPLSAHNPPEDIEDEDDVASQSQYGISPLFGIKLGYEKGNSALHQGHAPEFKDMSDYPNSDFFSEEGNDISKFMLRLVAYINTPQ
jgi:hypothetical protein